MPFSQIIPLSRSPTESKRLFYTSVSLLLSRIEGYRSVQSLSCLRLFATPWITARQASLSITNSRSSLRLTSIESVMPSSHLILCRPLSSCPQSLPPSESFPMGQLFAWGGQSTGVSASTSVLPEKCLHIFLILPFLIFFNFKFFITPLIFIFITYYYLASSVQFSRSVVCDSLRHHESQHTRPPCPSPTPRVHSNSHPSSRWCHPAISSSVIPFSCPQSLLASESFPMSQLFTWGGQSTGVSALASFLPKKSQGWSSSEWTGWISLQSKGLSRVFSNTLFKSINSSALSLLHSPTLTSIHDHWKNHRLH